MNRLKAALAVLIFSCAQAALAQQVLTLETKWNEKAVSITTSGVSGLTFDIAGFGAVGAKILGSTATFNGVDGSTYGATSVVTSTWTNVVGFDYNFYGTAGSSATLKIAQTIKMPAPAGVGFNNGNQNVRSTTTYNTPYPSSYFFTAPVISTSSVIGIPSGVLYSHQFRAWVDNPIFILSGLTTSSTYTLTVNYGVPK